MTLDNYFYENMEVGFSTLWSLLENIIEYCFNGDFDTYSYTKRGKIINKKENRIVCRVSYFIDFDGSKKVYFLDNIILEDIIEYWDNILLENEVI